MSCAVCASPTIHYWHSADTLALAPPYSVHEVVRENWQRPSIHESVNESRGHAGRAVRRHVTEWRCTPATGKGLTALSHNPELTTKVTITPKSTDASTNTTVTVAQKEVHTIVSPIRTIQIQSSQRCILAQCRRQRCRAARAHTNACNTTTRRCHTFMATMMR